MASELKIKKYSNSRGNGRLRHNKQALLYLIEDSGMSVGRLRCWKAEMLCYGTDMLITPFSQCVHYMLPFQYRLRRKSLRVQAVRDPKGVGGSAQESSRYGL
jgi:hypothetical protein